MRVWAFSSLMRILTPPPVNIGMGIFVLGMIFVAVIGNEFTIQAIYDDEVVTPAVHISFSFLAPFNMAKAMADINVAASESDTSGQAKNVTRTNPYAHLGKGKFTLGRGRDRHYSLWEESILD